MASRAASRQTTHSAVESDDPWPISKSPYDAAQRKWLVLTEKVNSDFPAGTFVIIDGYKRYYSSPSARPGQDADDVARTKYNTTYHFRKLEIKESRIQISTAQGVNAVMSSKLSLQKGGPPTPYSVIHEPGSMVYVIDDIPPLRDERLGAPLPIPKNTRVKVIDHTSTAGLDKPLKSSIRHTAGKRYVLSVTVEVEQREWRECNDGRGHMSFRRPRMSEVQDIERLNRPKAPTVVSALPTDPLAVVPGARGARGARA